MPRSPSAARSGCKIRPGAERPLGHLRRTDSPSGTSLESRCPGSPALSGEAAGERLVRTAKAGADPGRSPVEGREWRLQAPSRARPIDRVEFVELPSTDASLVLAPDALTSGPVPSGGLGGAFVEDREILVVNVELPALAAGDLAEDAGILEAFDRPVDRGLGELQL
jgi:hypothetical protein